MKQNFPGLNVQYPWSQLLASGKKTVETRFYPLPQKYVNQELALIETPGREGSFKARVIAIIIFGESFAYENEAAFFRDSKRHLLQRETLEFNWNESKGKRKWGWPVKSVRRVSSELPSKVRRGIIYTSDIPITF